jgi:CheY-like chemotaxis protein
VDRVEVLPATRAAMEHLLASHFLPYWTEKGWSFPGLPAEPADAPVFEAPAWLDEPPEEPPPEPEPVPEPTGEVAAGTEPAAEAAPAMARDEVLVVDRGETRCRSLANLIGEGPFHARFAATVEDVERELKRSAPRLLVTREDGPVAVPELAGLIREHGGRTELRVVPDYAAALTGTTGGDARMPAFLFEISRFLLGVLATAGGGGLDRAESRAKLADLVARRLNLSPHEVQAVRIAALLVELDTLVGRLRAGGSADSASAVAALTESILDPKSTPLPVGAAITARTEKFDGTGPEGLAGEAIPAGARILAAVDRMLRLEAEGVEPSEVEARIRADAGIGLDPRVVEALLRTGRAERLVDRLDADRERVILVDPDPVAASLLEMRLSNAGFTVTLIREGGAALQAAREDPPALIVSEVSVPGMDGFTLLHRLKKDEATADVPFLFVSERSDRSATVRGLELGADDFLPKPADLELLAAKAKGLVRKSKARGPAEAATAGVSGDLSEMELMDLLQVLASSGRSVRVKLESAGTPTGEIALDQGRVVDARTASATGVDAFNVLIAQREGRFTVTSATAPAEPGMSEPLESLLLEAARLLDEASRE